MGESRQSPSSATGGRGQATCLANFVHFADEPTSHDLAPEVAPVPFVGDEAALVRALRAGHPGAAAAFYDGHAGHVLHTLRSTLGADDEIPDLLQEVFIRGFYGVDTLREVERMRAWLNGIAILVASQRRRVRARRNRLHILSPDNTRPRQCEQPSLDARRSLQDVYDVLDAIPVKERMAFTLRYIDEMTLPAAAAVCSTSLATFKRRLARAERRFLRAARQRPAIVDWLEVGTRWPKKGSEVRGAR